MEIKDRIKIVREHFCSGNNKIFAEKLSEKPQTVSNWINRYAGLDVAKKNAPTHHERGRFSNDKKIND